MMTSPLTRRISFYISFISLVVCQQESASLSNELSLLGKEVEEIVHLSSNESISSLSSSSQVLTAVAMVHHRGKRNTTSRTSPSRTRRDIFHLYNMMSCTTQCDPLVYKGYGCYCGFLGSGLTVDAIDRCCKKHDYCYGDTPCRHQSLIYFVPYKWKCNGGHPYCVTQFGEMKASDHCAHHLCECDRQFAECIRQYPCPAKNNKPGCPSNPLRSLG